MCAGTIVNFCNVPPPNFEDTPRIHPQNLIARSIEAESAMQQSISNSERPFDPFFTSISHILYLKLLGDLLSAKSYDLEASARTKSTLCSALP